MITHTVVASEEREHVQYVLRLGDSALVLGQRISEWTGKAPILEEEMALANIALDLIGHADMLLSHAAHLAEIDVDADGLAFLRDSGQYTNALICELPNGDFAHLYMRIFLYASWALVVYRSLAESSDHDLAAIAAKAAKECAYHVDHAHDWLLRLGIGTSESAARLQQAASDLWPYTQELFTIDDVDRSAHDDGIAPLRAELAEQWHNYVADTFAGAHIAAPADCWQHTGGLQGRHTEALGYLLAEMQFLQRAYPGCTW